MSALEFIVPGDELPRLYRLAPFRRRGGRAAAAEMIWYDTAAGDLATACLSLVQSKGVWRLERARPVAG
jgi:hypothetical protein